MRRLAKKGFITVFLIIGGVIEFLSDLLYAIFMVKEYPWYDSVAEYLSKTAFYRIYGILFFLICAIIYSLYTKKDKIGKAVLVIAFSIYGLNVAWIIFLKFPNFIFLLKSHDSFYLLVYLSMLVVSIFTIIDILADNRYIKVLKVIYPIAGVIMAASNIYEAISTPEFNYLAQRQYLMMTVGTIIFWFALILWTMYLRQPKKIE